MQHLTTFFRKDFMSVFHVERLEMFFVVNNDPDEKRAASLLILIGGKMYALLKSLTTPTEPTELSFTEIVEIMGRHLTPKPIVIAERYKFHKCNQVEGQSIRKYLAKLQKLAETCNFGGYCDETVSDRLVCGITSQTIQRKLLGVADLTLKKAVDIAVGMELTEKEISEISREPETVQKVELHDPCFRCGRRILYQEIVFTKILSVTRANERATLVLNLHRRSLPSLQLKVNLSSRKLSKARKRKKIQELGLSAPKVVLKVRVLALHMMKIPVTNTTVNVQCFL